MNITRKKYSPVLLYVFLVIGAFLIGIVLFNQLILPSLVGRADVVIVPDLRGISVKLAEKKCRDSGLELGIIGHRNSEQVPEGYVIEQRPGPEGGLKEGRAIKVIVSAGRRMETVPELRNKSLRQAELLIDNSGLAKGRVVRIFSHEKGRSKVVSSSPPGGTTVPYDTDVDVLLSMSGEPRTYLMPNLVGMDLPFVKDRLERLEFRVTRVVSRRVRDKFPNTILSQNPKAGSSIKDGGTIELVVSTVE